MSYSSRLISNVRALFGCGRVLMMCFLVAYPLVVLLLAGKIPFGVGEVYFRNPKVTVQGAATGTPPAMLRHLRGEVSLPALTPEDESFQRRIGLAPQMFMLLVAFLVCQWMWKLCRNVENGEIFTSTNLKLVRRLGVLLIAEALVAFVLQMWVAGYVANHVRERVSFDGLEVVAPHPGVVLFHPKTMEMDLNQIIIGSLVLCLAEVFRQGLRLKEEADLTV